MSIAALIVEDKPGHKIFRGASPKTDDDWEILKANGIMTLLDLRTGFSDQLRETMKADKYGMRVYCHALGAILPPSRAEALIALHFLQIPRDGGVYIHCEYGKDRTGMIVAYYQICVQGCPKSVAVEEMKTLGLHPWYYWWAWSLPTSDRW